MKKIWTIFLISFANVLQYKGEMLVWLLLSIFNSMSILILWIAGFHSGSVQNISLSYIQTYYVAILVISQGLMSHAEEGIVSEIRTGNLSMHLLKPFPYFWRQFIEEVAWRVIGLFYSAIVFVVLITLIGGFKPNPSLAILPIMMIFMLTFVLSFLVKASLSMLAFFMTETRPVFELLEMIVIVVGGFMMPLEIMPSIIRNVAFHLPFAYMVYFPVKALTGSLPLSDMPLVIAGQIIWIGMFAIVYWLLWRKGLTVYTALGQ